VYKLPSNSCLSTRECPKILKISQVTKFDMGFHKNNMISRFEKIDFAESCGFLRQCHLKIKMSQHVTSFPWKDLKIFPFGMSQHFIYDPYLSRSWHGLSRYVTGGCRMSRDI
jgi:hypothetical protein